MNLSTELPVASPNRSWLDRPLWRRITPAVVLLLVIMLLSTGLHFYNLKTIGDANTYYTATVKSMLQSWHNFFFAAAEPGGSVTVDKPPLGFWIEAAFAAVLGVSGFSTSLPNILAGIFSLPILFRLVKRYLGSLAGLVAALVLAITPVILATDRNNTIDGMLLFTSLLAAGAFLKATESGKLRWLLLGVVLVGLGFNIKMLQAFLPLPAFYLLYLLGSRSGWGRKLLSLALATLVLGVVSFAWAVAVDLTPPDQRPYVGSSSNNSELDLIIGYNGLNRLLGRNGYARIAAQGTESQPQLPPGSLPGNLPPQQPGPGNRLQPPVRPGMGDQPFQTGPADQPGLAGRSDGSTPFSEEVGAPSLVRLFTAPLGAQFSWLLPLALVGLLLPILRLRLHSPLEQDGKALLLWGGWLVTCLVFFSFAGFFHAYYTIMSAPALAGMVALLVREAWELRRSWRAWLLPGAACATIAFQVFLVGEYIPNPWWTWLAAGLTAMGILAFLLSRRRQSNRLPGIAFGMLLLGCLVIPLAWSVLTVADQSADMRLPTAYRGGSGGTSQAPGMDVVDSGLIAFLSEHTQDVTYLVAVSNANQGAPLVLATGRPVLYMGGFSGSDPVADAGDLEQMVADGELRYVLYPGGFGRDSSLANWLGTQCSPVDSQASILTNAPGLPGGPGNMTSRMQLYDCQGNP